MSFSFLSRVLLSMLLELILLCEKFPDKLL